MHPEDLEGPRDLGHQRTRKHHHGTRRQCWFSHGICLPCTGNGESGTRQNCPHVGCNRLHPVTGAVASGAIPGRHENDWCSSATCGAVHW